MNAIGGRLTLALRGPEVCCECVCACVRADLRRKKLRKAHQARDLPPTKKRQQAGLQRFSRRWSSPTLG